MFQKYVVVFGVCAVVCASAMASMGDVMVGGTSAQFLYGQLSSRVEGVTKSEGKSLLRSRLEYVTLYDNLMQCRLKHGWVFESYQCNLPDSSLNDILAVKLVSTGGNDLNDALAEINKQVNASATLPVGGMSASRLFSKLSALDGKDKTFYKKEGTTRWLKNKYVGVGIDEMYCQRTTGRILGDSYKCFLFNTTVADSNAPSKELQNPDQEKPLPTK